MASTISKSRFKAQALEYFRKVQDTGEEVIITDRGQPVLKIVPYLESPTDALKKLRNSVIRYKYPLEPVGLEDWEALN